MTLYIKERGGVYFQGCVYYQEIMAMAVALLL